MSVRWQKANWIETLDGLPGLNLEEKARARVIILTKPREDRDLYFEGTYAEAAATIRALLRETPVTAVNAATGTSSVRRRPSTAASVPAPAPPDAEAASAALESSSTAPAAASSTAAGRTPRGSAPAAKPIIRTAPTAPPTTTTTTAAPPSGPTGTTMGSINAAALSRANGTHAGNSPAPAAAPSTRSSSRPRTAAPKPTTTSTSAAPASAAPPGNRDLVSSGSRVRWATDSVLEVAAAPPPPGPPPLGGWARWERSAGAIGVPAPAPAQSDLGMPHWSVIWARAMGGINNLTQRPTTGADFASPSSSSSSSSSYSPTPRASDAGLVLTFHPTLSFGLNPKPAPTAAKGRSQAGGHTTAAAAAARSRGAGGRHSAAHTTITTTPSYDTTETWGQPRAAAGGGGGGGGASSSGRSNPRHSYSHNSHSHYHHPDHGPASRTSHRYNNGYSHSHDPYASPFSSPDAFDLACAPSALSTSAAGRRPPAAALLVHAAANVRHLGSLPSAFRAAHLRSSQPGDVYCRTVRKVVESNGAGRTVQRRTRFVMVVDIHEGSTAVLVKVRTKELGPRRSVRSCDEGGGGGGGSSVQCYVAEVVPDPADDLDEVLARLDRREVRVADILMWTEAPAGWGLWDGSPQESSVLFERA
ncbi:hypothetical protein PLESTM_001821200 [Pleodorina starrii]|nr:hypothetical protein PLESTM_001821200 [Pleodorina starrii]